jgi:predicted enzyme related to lactoylglutathione lyase
MGEYPMHQPGTFCWVELGTLDTKAAKQFYSELFGWKVNDVEYAKNQFYTMLQINDKPVAALYELNQQQKEMNVAPHWMSYVCSDNANETVEMAKKHGGKVLMEAMDVMEEGRMGMIQDPEGAILGVWEPKNHKGFYYKEIPGTVCWVEHASHEKDKSIPFLENVFNWKAKTEPMGEMDYTTFFLGEAMVGGSYNLPPDMKDVPSNWIPYFAIENLDKSLDQVTGLKGKILMPKTYVKGVGHFAVIQDPQGAVLGLLQGEM